MKKALAEKKEREISKFWRPMVDHIDRTWKNKKGCGYPFTGRDFKLLKGAVQNFQEWGVMALWDVYLSKENDWIKAKGYSVYAFACCLPWLVDDPNWKKWAGIYEEKLFPPSPVDAANLIKEKV